MNNWISAVFSPTGGTSNIAAAIAGTLEVPADTIQNVLASMFVKL
jgi:hypothetical protein